MTTLFIKDSDDGAVFLNKTAFWRVFDGLLPIVQALGEERMREFSGVANGLEQMDIIDLPSEHKTKALAVLKELCGADTALMPHKKQILALLQSED